MLQFILQFLSVILITSIADVCWTMYMIEVGKKREIRAATWSSAIIALGGVTVISYTVNHWFILAAIFGSWIGTYWTVKREKNRKPSITPETLSELHEL